MRTVKPISSRDLKMIFNGREFTRRLSQAVNETLENWDETQFNVVRTLFGGKLIYGDVVSKSDVLDKPNSSARGGFLDGVERLIEEKGLDIFNNEVFPLIVYHTHTPPENSSDPSSNDLSDMAGLRLWTHQPPGILYDNTPLYLIGSLPDRNKLDLLVLQEKLKSPMGESIAEQIADSIEMDRDYKPNDNHIIARLLNSRPELNATLLTYKRNGNGTYRIFDEELAKLKRFSYAPKLLPEKS